MIIAIDESVANDVGSTTWLDRLLGRIEDGWHEWQVSGLERFTETLWVTTAGARRERILETYRQSVVRSGWSQYRGRRIRVVLEPGAADELAPESAFRLADAQLVILVENRDSDGAFLERVIQELDHALWKWWRISPAPARIDSVGGKGQMVSEVVKLKGIMPRPRYMVIVDSDRHGSGSSPSQDATRLKGACDAQGIPCWILAKREAENYLPADLLDLRPNSGQEHRLRVEAWAKLTDEQKDYFDMKEGLPQNPDPVEEELFRDLGDGSRVRLSGGFGEKVGVCWEQHAGQCRSSLKTRGGGDLESGLELLWKEV